MAIQFGKPATERIAPKAPKPPPPSVQKTAVVEKLASVIAKPLPKAKMRTDKKTKISVWIDNDILERLRSEGPDWQPRISSILRERLWSK